MSNWTPQQQRAINESDTNIIVSAGAGSGKTAVLTQRVITKLKNGVSINNLLILTFTNAAAMEMKERIRKAISSDESLKSELELLDSSYITTFDSFALSIVKKYHYLLNISKDISILDKGICDNVRGQILDNIFEEKYQNKDENFLKMINDLTIKDDTTIKKEILSLNELLDRLINKKEYLDNFINNFYNEENIQSVINKFYELISKKIEKINKIFENILSLCDENYYQKLSEQILPLLNSKTYNEFKINSKIKLPTIPKNSDEQLKINKELLKKEIDYLNSILIYKDENHLKITLESTLPYAKSIIEIINELDEKLLEFKNNEDEYEFNDVAKMAIDVVKNNPKVKEEITLTFKEIMVDEYQDTSDIQETLINLISNNNVYMVGDIKQSIYRFRNANPLIFKNKYNDYAKGIGGIKIDLLKNFRSRKEVINNINKIFNLLMDEDIGGADYKTSHQMIFGNDLYEKEKVSDANLDILIYNKENKKYSESEYEAFIIANDIKSKINNNYLVIDKDTKTLRPCKYDDFCILLDRKNSFETYKKIFEYLSLPLVIYYDEKITNEKDILVIKNIINLIIKIYNKEYDQKFKYYFYSIIRSFIYNESDETFINYFVNNNYYDSDLFKRSEIIVKKLDNLTNKSLIEEIVNAFNFYEKGILVGDIDKMIIRIDYLMSLAENLSKLGYSINMFSDYLNNLILNDSDITFSLNPKVSGSIRLMNIHKSKGLEFPICYYAGFNKTFNKTDTYKLFNFDKDLGIILPFYDDGVGSTILKTLYKEKYLKEDISERIRLFYVALTRAKEKMIMVMPNKDEIINFKEDYYSFISFIDSISFALKDNIKYIDNVLLTKKYNYFKEKDLVFNKNDNKLIVNEINLDMIKVTSSGASKKVLKLLSNEEKMAMEYGTKIHQILELSDFNTSDNDIVNNLINKIKPNFINVYKEYEFIDYIDNVEYNGIIDLIVEYSDKVLIIDYKLSNIDDENYIKQLSIYKKYIENKINKNIETYLYSIKNDELKKVNL
ncbi:MAG: UvrD-helicase domain-containing protein [Bacilli bacterium]